MRAVVHDRYGPPEVLRVAEVADPVAAHDEVLVRVHATTVSRTDVGLRSAELPISRAVTGALRPKQPILGMEFSGVVEAIGSEVTEFSVGDPVFGFSAGRAHAELVTIVEGRAIAHKPESMTFEEAASVCDGVSLALPCLRAGGVGDGTRILIYGTSGSVGTAAVQLAKALGATVTAVCGTHTADLARSLGADEVIDYQREDFTKTHARYDVVVDAVGRTSFFRTRGLLRPGGTYVDTDLGSWAQVPLLVLATRWTGGRKVKLGLAKLTKDDIRWLKGLIDAGRYRSVIDRTYPMEEVVEASRYVETGQKVGNVVLTMISAEGGAS
jgi:NADPH:quinone reductase-like Zn-dependent oxidoreductase